MTCGTQLTPEKYVCETKKMTIRVEFSQGMRPNAQRLVIIVEIPPEIVAKMNEERISPNPRALDIAKRVAEQQSLFSSQSYFPYHPQTIAKFADSKNVHAP